MLPTRRLQLQLAQVAMWTAKGAGVQNPALEDFLLDPPPAADDLVEADPEDAKQFFEFKPRK